MVTWTDRGTLLARGFASVCMETNNVEIWEGQGLLPGECANDVCATEPVQLLCRVLQTAAPCYRNLEWVPAHAEAPLEVKVLGTAVRFDSVAELAAAVQRFASAEGICVETSCDERSVTIVRLHRTHMLHKLGRWSLRVKDLCTTCFLLTYHEPPELCMSDALRNGNRHRSLSDADPPALALEVQISASCDRAHAAS